MGVSHAQIESFFNLEKLQLESFDDTLSSQKALSILGFHSKKGYILYREVIYYQ